MVYFGEHGNEPSGSIKEDEYGDKLSDSYLPKKYFAPWSKLADKGLLIPCPIPKLELHPLVFVTAYSTYYGTQVEKFILKLYNH
jgi:hypothetical protein